MLRLKGDLGLVVADSLGDGEESWLEFGVFVDLNLTALSFFCTHSLVVTCGGGLHSLCLCLLLLFSILLGSFFIFYFFFC